MTPYLNHISAHTTTFFDLSQLVRPFPAGCHATDTTPDLCSPLNDASNLVESFIFHIKTVPSAEPTDTYSESGLKFARAQSQVTVNPSVAKTLNSEFVLKSNKCIVLSLAHASSQYPFLDASSEVTLAPTVSM